MMPQPLPLEESAQQQSSRLIAAPTETAQGTMPVPAESDVLALPSKEVLEQRIQAAAQLAREFQRVLEEAGHIIEVAGRRYVTAAGWEVLASLLGFTTALRSLKVHYDMDNQTVAYVEAHMDILKRGEVVASAAGLVSGAEMQRLGGGQKEKQLAFAASFAQTRAVRKALSMLLGHVLALAKLDTEAEAETVEDVPVTDEDWKRFWVTVRRWGLTNEQVHQILGVRSLKERVLTRGQLLEVQQTLEQYVRRTRVPD